jgi:hypothetical protein
MQLITKSYFANQNYLSIPLAILDPSGAPSNATELDNLCIKIEREVMLNALGLTLYKLFFALDSTSIELPANARWKALVYGQEYEEKVWEGLVNEYSLIGYRIFETFTHDTNTRLSANGVTKVDAQNAENKTPAYMITNSNNEFIKKYQGQMLKEPYIYDNFIDYFGHQEEIERSMYAYLIDKKALFPEWKQENFRIYESKNSFGI